MAIIICEKHGRQGCFDVSPGVLKAIEESNPVNIVCITFLVKEDNELVDYGSDLYMKKEELGISPFTGVLDEDRKTMSFEEGEFDKMSGIFNPVCGACFREFIEQPGLQRKIRPLQRA
jgi:hypothetical protein